MFQLDKVVHLRSALESKGSQINRMGHLFNCHAESPVHQMERKTL